VQEIAEAEWVCGDESGPRAWPGGSDSGEWDAIWFDACRIVNQEKARIERGGRVSDE
jgi:hypothetical protein